MSLLRGASVSLGLLIASEARAQASSPTTALQAAPTGPATSASQTAPASGTSTNPIATVGEVVVTATLRAENLQKVPVSADVVTGAAIQARGDTNLQDLAQTLPTVQVVQAGASDRLSIRGIGSGDNDPLFEQAVATFIDGVYHGRSRDSEEQFLDIDRVEVLKGPQSLYFGNNAIAGALNILTKDPGVSETGFLRTLYNPTFNNYEVEGAVGGPITDTLRVRVAATSSGGDGFLEDIGSGKNVPKTNDQALRLTTIWTPTDKLTINLKISFGRSQQDGFIADQLVGCPAPSPFPTAAAGFCRVALADKEPLGIDNNRRSDSPDQGDDLRTQSNSAKVDYNLGFATLTSVTGYYDYAYKYRLDADGTPQNLFGISGPEYYKQFSQELRLVSRSPGRFQYIVGGYFQRDNLKGADDYDYAFLSPTIAGNARLGALDAFLPFGQSDQYNQNDYQYAAFAALTWNVTSRLSATAGLRETIVHKNFAQDTYFGTASSPFGAIVAFPSAIVPVANAFGKSAGLGAVGPRPSRLTDNHLSPSFNIKYALTDTVNTYFSYNNGFLAGGFNAIEHTGNNALLSFGQEVVDAYEVGIKSTLFSRRILLNLAVFRDDYSGFQTSENVAGVTGGLTNIISNVGGVRSQGIEAEATWRVNQQLTFGTSSSLLNSYFTSFPNDTATPLEILQGQPTVNLTNRPTRYAPAYSGNVYAQYERHLTSDLVWKAVGSLFYSARYNLSPNNDIFLEQPSYVKTDLQISLRSESQRWELSVIGKNLNNAVIRTFGLNVPSTPGSYFEGKEEPVNVAIQARYNF